MESLALHNFRAFADYRVAQLRPINLFVGMNNCGKTSILEAIHLLASEGDPRSLWATMNRRGERLEREDNDRRPQLELDIRHLFFGHELNPGSGLEISSTGVRGHLRVSYDISTEVDESTGTGSLFEDLNEPAGDRLVMHCTGIPEPPSPYFLLSRKGGISFDEVERRSRRRAKDQGVPVRFITTESFATDYLLQQWKEIALTAQEDRVIEALKILDDRVERLAFVGEDRSAYRFSTSRGGVLVKLRGAGNPVPIGSMGEGMWRILVLAICVIRSSGGVLLVDEIDTGLHHTVLADMWKLIARTAEQLSVQVFATTHSLDCVNSIAAAIRKGDIPPNGASIHRIEKERLESVRYSDREIVIAAERGTEMR